MRYLLSLLGLATLILAAPAPIPTAAPALTARNLESPARSGFITILTTEDGKLVKEEKVPTIVWEESDDTSVAQPEDFWTESDPETTDDEGCLVGECWIESTDDW
ncbi:Nn.00g027560.m01.CDS01 [Neocucurbitaria sp. VM-36]